MLELKKKKNLEPSPNGVNLNLKKKNVYFSLQIVKYLLISLFIVIFFLLRIRFESRFFFGEHLTLNVYHKKKKFKNVYSQIVVFLVIT